MKIDDKIDVINDLFDDLFLAGKFEEADFLLSLLDTRNMCTAVQVAVLSVTLAAKDKLPSRGAFYDEALFKAELLHRDRLLEGLE